MHACMHAYIYMDMCTYIETDMHTHIHAVRAGEKVNKLSVTTMTMQMLYKEGNVAFLQNQDTFEQVRLCLCFMYASFHYLWIFFICVYFARPGHIGGGGFWAFFGLCRSFPYLRISYVCDVLKGIVAFLQDQDAGGSCTFFFWFLLRLSPSLDSHFCMHTSTINLQNQNIWEGGSVTFFWIFTKVFTILGLVFVCIFPRYFAESYT